MKLLTAIQNALPNDNHLKLLYSLPETKEEVIYRRNGKSIDKIIEVNLETGSKVRATHFDYFDDKKIRSVDEYDYRTGKKVRTTNFVLYKSVDEYDPETGKKIRTINYNIKDENKISSVQEYDLETGKIHTVSIYKRDGKTIGVVKNIDIETGKVKTHINNRKSVLTELKALPTRNYDNIEINKNQNKEEINNLIDNLYKNKIKFDNICN